VTAALINVRIRMESEARAVPLCTWPVTELDSLIDTITRWGLRIDGNDDASGLATGSFVFQDNEAYFEVMVGDEDEGSNGGS
jgi:hypothetical protein